MLKFELINNGKDSVSYRYYPEGQGESGFITVDKKDLQIRNQKIASGDEFKIYFFKMYKRVKKYIRENEFRTEGIIAWY